MTCRLLEARFEVMEELPKSRGKIWNPGARFIFAY
jgi:hypothetical protein